MVYLFFYITPLLPTYKLETYITIYIKRLISLERLEAEFFVVSLLLMLWSRKLVSKSVNRRFLR